MYLPSMWISETSGNIKGIYVEIRDCQGPTITRCPNVLFHTTDQISGNYPLSANMAILTGPSLDQYE